MLIGNALRKSQQYGYATLCVPHMPYQRQDRQDKSRTPVSSGVTLKALMMFYPPTTSIITCDMHNEAIDGQELDHQIDHLYTASLLLEELGSFDDVVFVAPDMGASKRARGIAKRYGNADIVIVDKRRDEHGTEVMNVVGKETVKGKRAIIVDDIMDTGGTLTGAVQALKDAEATEVYACCTHPIFSVDKSNVTAEDKLRKAKVRVITTNSIWHGPEYAQANEDWLEIRSLAPMIANTIREMESGGSLSSMQKLD